MEIRIYGGGCARCGELAAKVAEVISRAGVSASVEKVTDFGQIAARGIVSTPALEVDGEIVSTGRVPSSDEIAGWLDARSATGCGCSCGGGCCSRPSKLKRLVGWTLLGLAVAALGIGMFRAPREAGTCCSGVSSPAQANASVTTVYYFHGARRCVTCNRIEALTRSAVEETFREEISKGTVAFAPVDVERPENEHYVQDFQLAVRSVVVRNGTGYERLDKVWDLVHGDEGGFRDYIVEAVRRRIGESK